MRSGRVDEDLLRRLIADEDDVAIAAVTVAELLVGVELADARRRPARKLYVADVGNRTVVSADTDAFADLPGLVVRTA